MGCWPVPDLVLGTGSFVCPDGGTLGEDNAPACATSSSEQDDLTEEVLIPPEGRFEDCESTLHG